MSWFNRLTIINVRVNQKMWLVGWGGGDIVGCRILEIVPRDGCKNG